MKEPILSVCLITYNQEKFVTQSIESILMQETNFQWKLVIADDYSTDSTRIIISKYKEKFPEKIHLIYQDKNVGPAQNFIDLITFPGSKYLAYLEGDDYWTDPYKLQKQVDFLEENPDYVACYHGCKHINERDEVIKLSRYETYNDQSAEKLLTAQGAMITHTVIFRNVIKDIKEFPEIFKNVPSGDTILYHLLGFRGSGKFLSTIEYSAYRIHSGGVWSSIDDLQRMKNNLSTMSTIKENLVLHFGKENDYIKKMHYSTFNNIEGYLYLSLYHKSFRMYFSMLKLIFTQKSFSKTFFLKQHLIDLFQRLFKIK